MGGMMCVHVFVKRKEAFVSCAVLLVGTRRYSSKGGDDVCARLSEMKRGICVVCAVLLAGTRRSTNGGGDGVCACVCVK